MIQWSTNQTVAPSAEPVTLTEAKAHCRIDEGSDDTYVTNLIKAAREWAEAHTGRQLINASWTLKLSAFPTIIQLPHPPLSSITSLAYVDTDGTAGTLTENTDFEKFTDPTLPQLREMYGVSWPTTRDSTLEAVTVTYVAGYGAASTSVPEGIRQAILGMVELMYTYRSPQITGTIVSKMAAATQAALGRYRVRFDVPWLSSYVRTYSATS